MELDEFVLDHIFHKQANKDGDVIYWRSCILKKDMNQGEQGYIVIYSDGKFHHTYHYPPNWIGE